MLSLKKLLNKPKLEDGSLLSLFYYCDIAVNHQMQELNTLMRISPDNLNRRSMLIRQLKEAQHNLMNVIMSIADQVIPDKRTSRDFRAKYPDDVLLDQISGPIWFGAECIAAGSHIANHEAESTELRPYATHLSKIITKVRQALRVQSYVNRDEYPKKIQDTLVTFDELWADFEFRYVSLMCHVKTESQYYHQQTVVVLFCESTLRAIKKKNLSCEMIEMMDPSVMFAIPRMAILCGLAIYPDGPLDPSKPSKDMPHCFRAYRHLLSRIKELLSYLDQEQLDVLEQALCSAEGLGTLERNKVRAAATKKKAKQQNGSNTTSHSSSSRHQHGDADDEIAAATATSVTTSPMRRPLSAIEQSPPTSSTLTLPTLNSHSQRRHSYNLDSRDTGNTVFEPIPVLSTTTGAIPVPVGMVELEDEPFPNLGADQPIENTLPSSSSPAAHTMLPAPTSPTQPAPPTSPMSPPSSSADTPPGPPRDDASSSDGKVTKSMKKSRSKGPAGFPSVEDLMHRLFLGISGVADQLQTNHAKDLRVILKNVFAVCQGEDEEEEEEEEEEVVSQRRESRQTKYSSGLEPCTPEPQSPMISASQRFNFPTESLTIEHTPSWIPDSDSPICSICTERFSWKRRRHHCRSCGNVVCSKCSPNNLPLFQFGIRKHVRVCTNCYISQLGQISLTVTGVSGQPLQVS